LDVLDGESLGVTDVGKVGDELEAIDDLAASGTTALDAEAQDTAETAGKVLLGRLVVGVALEAGVGDPADVLAVLEVLGQGGGVLGVALGAQRQSLDTDEELLGGEGVQAGTEVAQDLDTGADDVGDGAKGIPELEAVVAVGGLGELGEAGSVLAPIELAAVDDDTANGGAVAADPLGGRVDDDVGAVLNGADKVAASTEGVVDLRRRSVDILGGQMGRTHDQGDALGVGDLGNGGNVGDVVLGVANALDVHGLGLVVDGSLDVLDAITVDELGVDAEAGQEDLELVVGAAVEQRGGDDVVAGVSQGVDGDELSGLAGRGGQGSDTSLEGSDTLLEDVDGGLREDVSAERVGCRGSRKTHVHDTAVDVAELLEAKEPRAVGRVIEGEALWSGDGWSVLSSTFGYLVSWDRSKGTNRRGVDGNGARVGRRVGLLAVMGCQSSFFVAGPGLPRDKAQQHTPRGAGGSRSSCSVPQTLWRYLGPTRVSGEGRKEIWRGE
jgi:hypothetical protein